MKEVADKEKEMKKETAKDKVKDMDMKEDVDALTSGEDLSEEFKSKYPLYLKNTEGETR